MNTNNNTTTSEKPYDDSMWDNWTIYDNNAYVQDKDICEGYHHVLSSGNVVKSYRCAMKETYEIKH